MARPGSGVCWRPGSSSVSKRATASTATAASLRGSDTLVPSPAVWSGCRLTLASETPGGSSGVTLAIRPLLVARSSRDTGEGETTPLRLKQPRAYRGSSQRKPEAPSRPQTPLLYLAELGGGPQGRAVTTLRS